MRVLIVPNTDSGVALACADELVSWLLAGGHEPSFLPSDAGEAGFGERVYSPGSDRTPDLVVTLGGDGTILRAVHAIEAEAVPMLGINFGRLGFLTGADVGEMHESVAQALSGEARIDTLRMLDVDVLRPDGTSEFRALNEVFVGRGAGERAVEFVISVDARELMRFVCDGVIVATPAGSTAYALSVGGPFVAPTVNGSILVPVGAHTLDQRPFILGPDDVVEIACPNPVRSGATVVVDGVKEGPEGFGSVRVSRGTHTVSLVRPHGRDFYGTVRRKFLGGV